VPGGTDRFVSTDSPFGAGPGTRVVCGCRVVFGTLLGPEATGPGMLRFFWLWFFPGRLFLVSWLHRSYGCLRCFWRGVCGVCGTGLLFENYIVDASIFYKKQFPRNLNLDLSLLVLLGRWWWFRGSLEITP
jgi:hypothetical protein